MKLIAAMSGGVDSAVAAARAKEAGHDVIVVGGNGGFEPLHAVMQQRCLGAAEPCGEFVEEPATTRGFHHRLADGVEIIRIKACRRGSRTGRHVSGRHTQLHSRGITRPIPCASRRAPLPLIIVASGESLV